MGVIQTVRLQAAYKLDEPVFIRFPTLFNQGDQEWYSVMFYIFDLFFGSGRLSIYNNILMTIAMSFHPLTIPMAPFFVVQLPMQMLLDGFVYILWPQFDRTP